MMLKILLMPVKLLAIPLAMVLYTLHVLGSMVAGLASIPAGLMTLVLLLAGIQSAWHHEWFNAGQVGRLGHSRCSIRIHLMKLQM